MKKTSIILLMLVLIAIPVLVQAQKDKSSDSQASQDKAGSSVQSSKKAKVQAVTKGMGSSDNNIFTGSFIYSLSLDVLPGTAGLEPELNLQYNSASGNSWQGTGWSLSMGFIQRASKNRLVSYDDPGTFVYCYQGSIQELEKGGGAHEYHIKIDDTFVRYKFDSDYDDGKGLWTAWDKTGRKYLFGYRANSKIANPADSSQIFAWYLTNIIDPNGNEIYVDYIQDQNQLYPTKIEYSHYEDDTIPLRKILFTWEDRDDVFSNYRSGFNITTAKRLKEIETRVSEAMERKYEFSYTASSETYRSLLKEIKQVGKTNLTQTIGSFTYQYTDSPGVFASPPTTDWLSAGTDNNFYFADFNNDGKMDVANHVYSNAGLDVWFSTGNGMEYKGTWISPTTSGGNFYIADFNGDGYVDIARAYKKIQEHSQPKLIIEVFRSNQGTGLLPMETWYSKNDLTNNVNFQIADLNGDGKADMARSVSGGLEVFLTKDNQDEFKNPAVWALGGTGNFYWHDFNNDGKTDVARNVSASGNYVFGLQVWTSGGDGFDYEDIWMDNSICTDGIFFGDFNGDGIVDVAMRGVGGGGQAPIPWNGIYVWLSNGSGLTDTGKWADVHYISRLVFITDLNGDGLVDFAQNHNVNNQTNTFDGLDVWFNTGRNFEYQGNWTNAGTKQHNFTLLDYSGDGKADLSCYITEDDSGGAGGLRVWLNKGPIPDLLSTATNSFSGKTEVIYDSSSQFDNTHLPFPVHVVKSISIDDALPVYYGNHVVTTQYEYSKGLFDREAKEFLGFGEVKSIDLLGNYTITKFYQDEVRIDEQQSVYVNVLKGKLKELSRYDADDTLLATTINSFNYANPYTKCYFPYIESSEAFSYDDVTKHTKNEYSYDVYGNVTQAKSLGDVDDSLDDVTVNTYYAYKDNQDYYLVGYPVRQTTKDSGDSLRDEIWFSYDDADYWDTAPTKGNLTKIEKWLNTGGGNPVVQMTYDKYGNILTTKDANQNITTNFYDGQFNTFPVAIVNALNHTQSSTYDPGTGQVLTTTDPNNQTVSFDYDDFGRLLNIFKPTDPDDLPSVSYTYDDDLQPRRVTIRTKEEEQEDDRPAKFIINYQFYDGLGRLAQSQIQASSYWECPIISGVKEYDSRGQLYKSYMPFFVNKRERPFWYKGHFFQFLPLSQAVEYQYDALGRLTQQQNPDGTSLSLSYSGWTENHVDSNIHKIAYTKDAYNRITEIREYLDTGEYYLTQYSYDAKGNLTRIKNAAEKWTEITYDTLNRKTKMTDPKMGEWSYNYDSNGNLIWQKDAKQQVVQLTYDALNRIATKTYIDPVNGDSLILYAYDVDADDPANQYTKGRLVKVTDLSGYTRFIYDSLGQVIETEKAIQDGAQLETHTTRSEYNAMGQQTKIIYPNGAVMNYTYNYAGDLSGVNGTINNFSGDFVKGLCYNVRKQIIFSEYGDGTATAYEYNPQNTRLTKLITGTTGGFVVTDPSFPEGGNGPDDGGGGDPEFTDPDHGDGGGFYFTDPVFISPSRKNWKAFQRFLNNEQEVCHENE